MVDLERDQNVAAVEPITPEEDGGLSAPTLGLCCEWIPARVLSTERMSVASGLILK